MTDTLNGLRFDINERVNLSEDVAAIEELEEIELVPRMQALNQGNQTLLKGHLLLTGVYRSSERRGQPLQLEHKMPVEISLPAERLQRGEDLTIEIENFDVDVLSPRAINVTGVLALRGLQPDLGQLPVWRDDSFTVVHQASPDGPYDAATDPSARQPSGTPDGSTESTDAMRDLPAVQGAAVQDELLPADYPQKPAPDLASDDGRSESADAAASADDPLAGEAAHADGELTQISDGFALSEPAAEKLETKLEDREEEKAELKVALGVKPQSAQSAAGVGMLSMLGDKWYREEPPQAQAPEAPQKRTDEDPSPPSRTSTGDELEWTKLFVSAGGEVEPFRKVRMCIVQRSDTLESIAARYNVQPRELQQRNQLNDNYLSEGQVLYIP